ncbi:MAG: 3'-5' exonuclease [Planctomycetes bacterium]|nr:3'-5' exonuclease [Planctomycetota bacterium]MCB9909082.1 3'-5' exonuclease [Planctomycetota bacterium]MCB9911671.1 3'-5' exonuclease [Planctomycetota bacterium]HPF13161.1 3'-5' exonuclease [Planctomycetota bacterium]HRV81286.1 3'-5' exonuclease [Planctomycetota bacterium]
MRPIICLDTETATMAGAPHLLELGAVRVVDGEIEDTFEALVCPAVAIEPETTAIHGITNDDVRRAPFAPEVLARFSAWAGDDWLAAHNAPFDTRVLGFEYARAGLEPPRGSFLDSLILARRWIPESPDHKLVTLCQVLDFDEGDHHRALADAVWCWKVIEECFERAADLGEDPWESALGEHRRPLTIAARGPARAKMSPRLRPLERAIRDGVTVRLLYGEDMGNPFPLEVRPKMLYESHAKSYLEGECQRSGELKTYLLQKIRKVILE